MQKGPCNWFVGLQSGEVLLVSAKTVGPGVLAKTTVPTEKPPVMSDASTQTELVRKESSMQTVLQ